MNDLFVEEKKEWDMDILNQVFVPNDVEAIVSVPLSKVIVMAGVGLLRIIGYLL